MSSPKKKSTTKAKGTQPVRPAESAKAAGAEASAASASAARPALTEKATTPPAKAAAVSPAVKSSGSVAVAEKAQAPAVKDAGTVAVRPADTATKDATKSTTAGAAALTPLVLPGAGGNPYQPHVATVAEVIRETHNIVTLRVVLDDAEVMKSFRYAPGQVGQVSVFGVGEATFVINSPPSQKGYLQFSVMRTGEVTEAIHRLSSGDKVGIRAPLGKGFPVEQWKGKDIFFVGGGIGMAPIRTVMLHLLEAKQQGADYGKISLLYGARSPRDMAYSYELDDWMGRPDLDCTLTIDNPFEGWEHRVGLIPHVLLELAPDPARTIAVLCGPPIMIKFTVEALKKLEFPDESIITTLEKRMKCGIGICGRCNIGAKYVCVDGPVFSWAELKELPPDM